MSDRMDPYEASGQPSKEEAAEQAWRDIRDAEDAKRRRDQVGQRNALIAGLLGLVALAVGIALAGTMTDWRGDPAPATGQLVAVLGIILLALGIYFRNRRPK